MVISCTENISINNIERVLHEVTFKELRQMNQIVAAPFQLLLTENDNILECDQIVRIIPGKRIVAFGTWNEMPVVAKLFFSSGKAKQHLKKEIAGVEALISSGVPTPKILWSGSAQKQKIQIILFERIMDAVNLDEIWQKKDSPEELTELMKAVTLELATQHVLGIVQHDLHLKNFLISHNKIYTLDGGSITHQHTILSKEDSIDHLALFFSQLGIGTEALQHDLFQTYVKARSWLVKKANVQQLRKAMLAWTKKRWERYEHKIQRNCTAFACKKTFSTFMLYDRSYLSAEFSELLKNPESAFQQSNLHILKAGNSSTVIKVKIDNHYFVVKRYNIKNMFHALRRCLRMTRAAKSWNLAQRMCLFGIPTAKPVAFIENRVLGFRGKSYFIMEYINGPHAGDYFSSYRGEDTQTPYSLIAERILLLFKNLARLHLIHGDLKMTNILIDHTKPVLIDLDGMVEHKTNMGLKLALQKELKRFMKNWKDKPSIHALFERLIAKL